MTVYVLRYGRLVPKDEAAPRHGRSLQVMSDIEPFQSPIDGTVITSRSQLREHEQRHGVRQVGNDWSGSTRPSWWDAEKHRIVR